MTDGASSGHLPIVAGHSSSVLAAGRDLSAAGSEAEAPGRVAELALSFEAVYAEHFALVWRSLRALGFEGMALEDAVQDVFLTVHRRLETFEQRSALSSWLYGIVRFVARNYWRRQRRKGGVEALQPGLPSTAPDPEQQAEDTEALRFVQTFLDELDEGKREVFMLCELEQVPAPEAAALLGMKLNTVYSRLRAARQAFSRAAAARTEEEA